MGFVDTFKKKADESKDKKPVVVSQFETILMGTETDHGQKLLADLGDNADLEVYPEIARDTGVLWIVRHKARKIGYIEQEFYEGITKEYGSRNNPRVINYRVAEDGSGRYICNVAVEVVVYK